MGTMKSAKVTCCWWRAARGAAAPSWATSSESPLGHIHTCTVAEIDLLVQRSKWKEENVSLRIGHSEQGKIQVSKNPSIPLVSLFCGKNIYIDIYAYLCICIFIPMFTINWYSFPRRAQYEKMMFSSWKPWVYMSLVLLGVSGCIFFSPMVLCLKQKSKPLSLKYWLFFAESQAVSKDTF